MERLRGKADFFRTFHQLCARLLSPLERQILQQALHDYRTSGHVEDLVSRTSDLWASPSKLQLLPFVRQVVTQVDRPYFDAFLGIHEGYVVRGPRSDVSKLSSLSSTKSGAGNQPIGKRGGVHVIKVGSAASPQMGFSVRGGSEFGLGIFISQVDPGSPAEKGGLRSGDQILETNGVDLETASSDRAVELLNKTHTHTLVVRRTRKIPEWKVTKERILWHDVASGKLVAAPSGEATAVEDLGSEVGKIKERKVVLRLTRSRDFVGLNIRGGKDFGLGIYISRVDPGGLAEKAGVEVGDQLVQVNKQRLDSVSHAAVVHLLRSHRHLVLTLWAVGKFPAYKEVFTEYVWSDTETEDNTDTVPKRSLTYAAELHPEPRLKARHKTDRVTQRTKARESRVDRSPRDSGIDLNGVDLHHVELNHPDPDYDDVDLEDSATVRSELFYPRDQDIIFRGNYAQSWRQLDKAAGPNDTASTLTENKASSSATYGGPAVSLSDTDSHSSDDMDYTTFLERKARRDEEKASAKRRQRQASREAISAKTAKHPDSQSADDAQVTGSSIGVDSSEPILVKATDRSEALLVKSTDHRVEYTPSYAYARAEPTLAKAEDKTEPALITTTITVNTDNPQPRYSEMQSLSIDRTNDRPTAELARRDQEVKLDGDVGDVVSEPSELQKQQHQNLQSSDYIYATPTRAANRTTSANHRSRSVDAPSTTSRSSSEDSNDSYEHQHGHGSRHHRTHVYHISGSPPTMKRSQRQEESPVRQVGPQRTSTPRDSITSNSKRSLTMYEKERDEEEDEDNVVVVTEVMNEVAIRTPSPSPDVRRRSIASNSSNSDSTEAEGGGGRKQETGDDGVSAVELLEVEIKRLEARQSNIGSKEISALAEIPGKPGNEEKHGEVEDEKKLGKWSALKKKLTSSMRIKKGSKRPTVSAENDSISMGSIRKKGIFERRFGSQMMNQQTEDKYNLMMVEERARYLLSKDESDAVLRHIKTYHEEKDLDRLVEMLTAILDRPDKLLLLKDIRGVVLPGHVGRFDSLVARHEQGCFEASSSKMHLPLSPVHHLASRTKPRPKLMTTVLDADGHFHIQSVDHEERDIQRQIEVVDAFRDQVKNPTNNNNNSSIYNNQHTYHQPQRRRLQDVYFPNSNNSRDLRSLPPEKSSGVASRNGMNSHVPVPSRQEWRDDLEVIIVEKAPMPPPPAPAPPEEGFVVYLSKQKKNLGLIVCGGAGDHMDPSVRIEMVMPWGAAADDQRIESGMHILSVDDQSVRGLTQSEAIALLKRCFTDVRSVNMKLRLKKP